MIALFFWTSAIGVSLLVLWFGFELLWALVATASWVRFTWHASRARGAHVFPGVLLLLPLFVSKWGLFLGSRKGHLSFFEDNGRWDGIGDWCVRRIEDRPGARRVVG